MTTAEKPRPEDRHTLIAAIGFLRGAKMPGMADALCRLLGIAAYSTPPTPLFLKDVDPHPDRAGDCFRPRHEPARFLYDTLCDEMALRKTPERLGTKWVDAERQAMLEAAAKACAYLGRRTINMDHVLQCENQALGHTDYAAKWAYALADAIRRQPPTMIDPPGS